MDSKGKLSRNGSVFIRAPGITGRVSHWEVNNDGPDTLKGNVTSLSINVENSPHKPNTDTDSPHVGR